MLLCRKKKYAAVRIEPDPSTNQMKETIEYKGLDIVRRDWCLLAKEAGKRVVDYLLSDQDTQDAIQCIVEYLTSLLATLEDVNIQQFSITKQLTKPIEHYPADQLLPHVLVAKRLAKMGTRKNVYILTILVIVVTIVVTIVLTIVLTIGDDYPSSSIGWGYHLLCNCQSRRCSQRRFNSPSWS